MNISELNVGNIIFEPLNEDKKAFKVFEVYHEECNDKINFFNALNFEPVPLTEEWMRKFKFELFPWGWVLNEILIKTNHKNMFWVELGNGKRIKFEYVHTLQNFMALTGNELNCD